MSGAKRCCVVCLERDADAERSWYGACVPCSKAIDFAPRIVEAVAKIAIRHERKRARKRRESQRK